MPKLYFSWKKLMGAAASRLYELRIMFYIEEDIETLMNIKFVESGSTVLGRGHSKRMQTVCSLKGSQVSDLI